jgi:1-aminocyclopropane-1-carboxylate deaminase/D-cysteine desulfhydrase-like pyridoxal-dependent ACC family enzyme/GNAT superfamily N-acetyltransferase
MQNIEITIQDSISLTEIKSFLLLVDDHFSPSRIHNSLSEYAEKLKQHSSFVILKLGTEIMGLIPFYRNDRSKKRAFISLISIKKEMRGQGYGKRMLEKLYDCLQTEEFEALEVELWEHSPNETFYKDNNFYLIEKFAITDSDVNKQRIRMKRWLWGQPSSDKNGFFPSLLEYHPKFSQLYSVNLFLKRDDWIPKFGGGNKVRKLYFILNAAIKLGCNAIVTAGGDQSNHCRATALFAASLGWKTVLVIHGKKPDKFEGNLKFMKLAGAELRFVQHADVKESMDQAMLELKNDGYKPYYIWGGGHSLEGAMAFYEAVKELKVQLGNIKPDYLVVASGTGATQAGLEVGVRQFFPQCKVLGVSVARETEKGKKKILHSIECLNANLNYPIKTPQNIFFDTSKCGTGYEKVFPSLIKEVEASVKEGLVIDPTYTGKAFFAMKQFIQDGTIDKNSNVIFWHTGGQNNLLTSGNLTING